LACGRPLTDDPDRVFIKRRPIVVADGRRVPQWHAAHRLEAALNLPDGFINSLQEEDDWSFVIKTHALAESAVSFLLVQHIGEDRLQHVIARLDLGDTRAGKLKFIKALDLLPSDCLRFIRKLLEIRNSLVHDIGMVSFSFQEFVGEMESTKASSFLDALGSIDIDMQDFGNDKRDWIARNTKFLIFRALLILMTFVWIAADTARKKQTIREKSAARLEFQTKLLDELDRRHGWRST
jgi:hypothetical protein